MLLRWLCYTLLLIFLSACQPADQTESAMTVESILGARDTAGFNKAVKIREFNFPRDHGPHPEFKNEWWYITGNLTDPQGQKFGYQITFFRLGMKTGKSPRKSAWAAEHLWMAHAAVTESGGNKHLSDERFSRDNPGLAGAQWQPFQVWLDDWQLASPDNEFPWRLVVNSDSFAFELLLEPLKDIILQGEQGLSRKSETPGNASYYYSMTRLKTTGELIIENKTFNVDGLSWLDREWGTSSLDKEQVGWDWFSLQLNSGEDLMYYQLRDKSGQPHPASQGMWVKNNGDSRTIPLSDIRLKPLDWWRSDKGERYPVRWEMEYLPEQKKWIIAALVEDQHMNLSFSYWEGAVGIFDYTTGKLLGSGYLEMTGY